MRRGYKLIGAALLLMALAAAAIGSSGPAAIPVAPAFHDGPHALEIPPQVADVVQQATQTGAPFVEMELQVDAPEHMEQLKQAVLQAGGQVISTERTFLQAKLPPAAAASLPQQASVVAVGVNQTVSFDAASLPAVDQLLPSDQLNDLARVSMDPMGVSEFRAQTGSQGRGVKVAVIDTGVDPDHLDLLRTVDGQRKIIDWKNFTGEGYIKTSTTVDWSSPFTAPDGRKFTLPSRPAVSTAARFGFLDEFNIAGTYLYRDLDQNGSQTDRFGILLVDAHTTGVFDTVYVDTNNDGSFQDEDPLQVYRVGFSVGHLGRFREGRLAPRRLNLVVDDVDAGGTWVSLGFDAHGHGTQVAGVLGAYNPNGFIGMAPGVQIMALKAVSSNGSGNWFEIRKAIEYAATHGANVINVSIGGLAAAAARRDSTASEWLNQIARQSGALIVLAADNTGPGLSSGTTLGNPAEVMAVGAYYSPAMWKRDFGYTVPHESIWSLSGMGPRSDGSYVPSVVGPGGSPTTSPLWRHETGYTTAVGTSIATPHVSGAAALLMEAGKRTAVQYDRLSVKRALELGARKVPDFGVYEQGYGLVSLLPSFSHLKQINSIPGLKARSREGDGGLLARSYTPGSSAFVLTNLDPAITRVGVYSSADWVQAGYSTMTLPPLTPRELPLQLNAPTTSGVHSAFVMVTNLNKYGPSLTIPITYVRPIDLRGNAYATTDQLEVARYHRYFFAVPPGAGSLNVTARVPQLPEQGVLGTVKIQVFRPDGQAVHTADIGLRGAGLTTLFGTDSPVDGTWEVVVTSLPDSDAARLQASYSLDVQVKPGPAVEAPLKVNVPAGSTTTVPIKLSNVFGPFKGQASAVGLVKADASNAWAASVPWHVEKKVQNLTEEFTLNEFTTKMRLELSNPVPANVDMSLSLYYYDRFQGWRLRAQSAHAGTSEETLEVNDLPTGRYQVIVTADDSSSANLQYQYRRLMAVEGYHLFMDDPVRTHDRGEIWTANLTIKAPNAPGRYTGQILINDADGGQTLSWVPIEVSVGQPAVSVNPLVPQLTIGKPGTVVLEIRDAQSGKLTDTSITVNGRRFVSRGGRVAVPITPTEPVQTLEVTVNEAVYRFYRTSIKVTAAQNWGLYPLGVDHSEDLASWWRKVTSPLPQ